MLEDEEDEDGPCAIFAAPSMCCARDSRRCQESEWKNLKKKKEEQRVLQKGHGTRFGRSLGL